MLAAGAWQRDSVIHTCASILVQTLFHYNVALNRHSSVFLLQGPFASRLQAGLGAHPLPLCFPIVCASSDRGPSFMHKVLTPAPGARPGRSLPGQLGECARHPRPHPKYVILKLWPYETAETPGIFLRPGGEITPPVTSQWVSPGRVVWIESYWPPTMWGRLPRKPASSSSSSNRG